MPMNISGISTNVQTLLEGMNDPDPTFKTVLAAPPTQESDFEGYPSASHYYTNAESNYATVSQNRRVIEYVVELYIVPNTDTPLATALTEAYALSDRVMDMFDHSIDLSSTDLGLSPACDIMRPTPGTLERIETNEGDGFMMTLRLYCEGDITYRNL